MNRDKDSLKRFEKELDELKKKRFKFLKFKLDSNPEHTHVWSVRVMECDYIIGKVKEILYDT